MDSIEKKFAGDYDNVADGRVSADVVSFLQYGIFHLQTGYFWVQGYTELHQLEVQHIMC